MAEKQLKQLIRKRDSVKHKLTNFISYFTPVQTLFETDRSLGGKEVVELESRVEKLERFIDEFEEIQDKIEELCAEEQLNDHFKERDDFTNLHSSFLASAKTLLSSHCRVQDPSRADTDELVSSVATPQVSQNTVQAESHIGIGDNNPSFSNSSIRLPPINLPTFNGDFNKWLEFKDTFEELIDKNSRLSAIQKFHYLRSSLGDEAQKIIYSLEFSATNYEDAWQLLCERFDNTRLLVNNHIKSLFEAESLPKESASGLRNLIDTVKKHLRALKSLHLPTNEWDVLVIYIITSKLDKWTSREWEKSKNDKALPTLTEFFEFLKNKADFLETIEINSATKESKEPRKPRHLSLLSKESQTRKCHLCNGDHMIYRCDKFLQLEVSNRWEKIKHLKLCSNCLCKGHISKACKFGACKHCARKHNSLLHYQKSNSQESQSQQQSDASQTHQASSALVSVGNVSSQDSATLSFATSDKENYTLLSTAVVHVFDDQGKVHEAHVILDSGSQSCFISEDFCKKLKLKLHSTNVSVSGISNVSSQLQSKCDVKIKSVYNNFTDTITCFVVPSITDNLPSYSFDVSTWNIPEGIILANPSFNKPKPIDILIGASLFWSLILEGRITLGKNRPILQNTVFGYIVSGSILQPVNKVRCHFTVEDDLQKFLLIEETGNPLLTVSKDDMYCEEYFQKTVSREPVSGKFIVRLPLRLSPSELGESKSLATKRLLNLERRFEKDQMFKNQYTSFMQEYRELDHMAPVPDESSLGLKYFLPHHGVIKDDSLSTKCRVVFDGSAKSSTGKSLNDLLYSGPAIHNDIFGILLRFRQYRFVVISDIAKMFRQILVHKEDRYLQNIVWRDDTSKPVSVFELNTVTYGQACAPYLAIRCIKQLAIENKATFPVACEIISRDIYVDDLITGFETEEEATRICGEISNILNSANFNLRKWSSNSSKILNSFEDSNDSLSVLQLCNDTQIKTLGVEWCNGSDCLSYHIAQLPVRELITKRTLLSDMAKIFDPLGIISPSIVLVKILIQRLWTLGIDWDDNVPPDLVKVWQEFQAKLNFLSEIKIPRRVIFNIQNKFELHGFSDSSQKAYSAVIYVRSIDANQQVHVRLLCSKTKVAPLKQLTVPRLELCGAVTLSRLMKTVRESLSFECEVYYWCDSQVVLHWLHTESRRLQVFVCNRVSEIQSLTDIHSWSYVNTSDNPADIASRGLYPDELVYSSLWWDGPSFLYGEVDWPKGLQFDNKVMIPELRKESQTVTCLGLDRLQIFHRYSTLTKLVRVTAYCLRFFHNVKSEEPERKTGPLTAQELNSSTLKLVKLAQEESFSDVISVLKSGKQVKRSHNLLALTPFLDGEGLMRVGGRLRHSNLDYSEKHPLLLNGKHRLTRLIFQHEHLQLQHAGPQLLLACVRRNYWATSAKTSWFNYGRFAKRERVQVSSPFSHTGVDYAGPVTLKDRKGRFHKTYKAYICIFICFATKAIHIELVTDLTTESFIAAFRRFSSRRGKPAHLHSDNGSNFLGAQRELKMLYTYLANSQDELTRACASEQIVFHFIPPSSPSFGGLWESNIKGIKYHLYRVVNNAVFTFEECYTLLTQIEATLNSRPLYPMSSDPNDFCPLTPSHFLIGKPLVSVPDPLFTETTPTNRLTRFQLIQQLNHSFWKRWSSFYLSELQKRSKWQTGDSNLKVGTMIILKNDHLPPCNWPIGRIVEVHPGLDSVVRVVTVRTATGTYKRAISKVCPLPLPEEETF